MTSPDPNFRFEAARVLVTVACPDCQGEGQVLIQSLFHLPRESDVPVIAFCPCVRCNKMGRIQLEIPLEQFRYLIVPQPKHQPDDET